MKLTSFWVENFRSVKKTGNIETEKVTAFVGVNESGKTNLLLPLWKLNPAKEGAIEPTSDYPKNNYQSIRANPEKYSFVHATFDIGDDLAKEFSESTGFSIEEIREVELSKKFDGEFTWWFPKAILPKSMSSEKFKGALDRLETSINLAAELASEAGLKSKIISAITAAKPTFDSKISVQAFDKAFTILKSLLPSEPAKKSSIAPLLAQSLDQMNETQNAFHRALPTDFKGLWGKFSNELPVFLYYSNYGNLDSEIYLPHVVQNLTRQNLGAKEAAKARTLKVLFSFVGLDPQEILELGRDFKDPQNPTRQPTDAEIEVINKKKKDRSILLQSAGTKLTGKFKDWWKQGDYRFRFDADGDHFRIWVSDDRRPEEVELEGRSTGLQWFLSFYLVFLVESEGEHKNAILLLDEPGLSLHPWAQRNLSEFFESLSDTNQILYTTHSPFLIDADNLDQARKVYVSEDGSTKATSNLNEGESKKSQPGATYALNSALNLHVAESLLIGCEPIVVEGPSDQYILTAIKTMLIGGGKIKPQKELVFPPGGGAKSVKIISSILLGRDDALPIVLLDDDNIGKSAARDLKSELYKTAEARVLNLATYAKMPFSEIEDLVPAEVFVDLVDREFKLDEMFKDVYQTGSAIVPQVEKWAAANKLVLEKGWKVPIAVAAKKRLLGMKLADVDADLVQRWTLLFEAFQTT